jgi:hypothetical protein
LSQPTGRIGLASLLNQMLCIRTLKNGGGYKYILDWRTFVNKMDLYFVIIFEKVTLKKEKSLSEKLVFVF